MSLVRDTDAPPRFAFGENWAHFAAHVDADRQRIAERSLTEALQVDHLRRKSFLDAGSGSGLFSLAALRLGAEHVQSFDFDADSVACAENLRERFAPGTSRWMIESGDLSDSAYCASLGKFDVVYCFGVAHHTGAMWRSIANLCDLVTEGGLLYLTIYNDQGVASRLWRSIKRTYNDVPRALKAPYVAVVALPLELRALAKSLVRGAPQAYVKSWRRPKARGMSRWHDLVDWVGGYPFEVATPQEVFDFCRARGLVLEGLHTVGAAHGCNQFLFRRPDH